MVEGLFVVTMEMGTVLVEGWEEKGHMCSIGTDPKQFSYTYVICLHVC